MGRPRKAISEQRALARITKELVKENSDVSDVGAILACLKGDVKSLEALNNECASIDEFLEVASKKANIALVVAAIEAAVGYDFEETVTEIRSMPKYDENGTPFALEIPVGKKVYKKHAKKDPSLLKFILANRLPEYFSDVKKVEISKKSIEIKANTEAEIKQWAGKLLNVIDADFVEK